MNGDAEIGVLSNRGSAGRASLNDMETARPLPRDPPLIDDLEELGMDEVAGETGDDSLPLSPSPSTSIDSSAVFDGRGETRWRDPLEVRRSRP